MRRLPLALIVMIAACNSATSPGSEDVLSLRVDGSDLVITNRAPGEVVTVTLLAKHVPAANWALCSGGPKCIGHPTGTSWRQPIPRFDYVPGDEVVIFWNLLARLPGGDRKLSDLAARRYVRDHGGHQRTRAALARGDRAGSPSDLQAVGVLAMVTAAHVDVVGPAVALAVIYTMTAAVGACRRFSCSDAAAAARGRLTGRRCLCLPSRGCSSPSGGARARQAATS